MAAWLFATGAHGCRRSVITMFPYLIILFLHHNYKDTSDSNLLCHQHDNHHWKVGVSADVEIGEKIDQRASWNSSLGVRSFKMLCS